MSVVSAWYAALVAAVVVDRLAEHHATILRTDRDGLISIRTDGRRLYVETFAGVFKLR